jgi:hypothetical protein
MISYLVKFLLKAALFCELWRRENHRLAFDWNVEGFENDEPDLPEYTRRTNKRKEELGKKSDFVKYLWSYEHYFKILCSYCILIFMVTIRNYLIIENSRFLNVQVNFLVLHRRFLDSLDSSL